MDVQTLSIPSNANHEYEKACDASKKNKYEEVEQHARARLSAEVLAKLHDLHAGTVEDTKGLATKVERTIAKGQAELAKAAEVVLYCNCPNEVSSARMALLLRRKGVMKIRPLQNGLNGWRDLGYPVEKSKETSSITD